MPKKLEPSDWKFRVPPGMKGLNQWVGWSTGQGRKVPKQLKTGRSARANDPATWSNWEAAATWYEQHQRDPTRGVGFVFKKGCGLVFVDVDDCLTAEGKLKDWAEPLVRPFLGHCYAERSPGGSGLHLFLIASFPPNTVKSGATWKVDPTDKKRRDNIAVFDDRRFSTVTGDVYENSRTLMPCQGELDLLLAQTGLDKKLGLPPDSPSDTDEENTPETIENVKKALDATDPDLPYDQWLKVGMALRELGDVGFKMWDQWSHRGAKYKPGETRTKWAGFKPEGVGLGSVFFVAEEEGGFTLRTGPEDDFASFKGVGVDDLLGERYEPGSVMKWKAAGLHLVAKGSGKNLTVKPSEGESNIGNYLQNHDRWRGQLRFNERSYQVERLDGERLDLHEMGRHLVHFMEWGRSPSRTNIFDAATGVAAATGSYDPVRDWLRDLKWDHAPRIDTHCALVGLENTALARRQVRRWLIGAVARAFRPGCKMQNMLVLYGAQGKLKSAWFERIAMRPEWYSESAVDMSGKDGQVQLLGPWIVENGELSGMSKADVDKVKVFVSESVSRFRRPYGRESENHPRRCVLGGTTNETEFLRDSTGARRFWLVAVLLDQGLRIELMTDEYVAQLWAEAVVAYRAGERWWDQDDEVDEVMKANEDHFEGTALDACIDAVLVDLRVRAVTTVQEVQQRLTEKYRFGNLRNRDVAGAMRRAGWVSRVLRMAGTQRRFWSAPDAQEEFLHKAAEQALARMETPEFPAIE